MPFLHFSAWVYSVMGLPPMPQVPMPTRPLAASGVAKIDFLVTPFSFLVCHGDKKGYYTIIIINNTISPLLQEYCNTVLKYHKILLRYQNSPKLHKHTLPLTYYSTPTLQSYHNTMLYSIIILIIWISYNITLIIFQFGIWRYVSYIKMYYLCRRYRKNIVLTMAYSWLYDAFKMLFHDQSVVWVHINEHIPFTSSR